MTVFPYLELDADKEAEYQLFPINLTRMMLHTQRRAVGAHRSVASRQGHRRHRHRHLGN